VLRGRTVRGMRLGSARIKRCVREERGGCRSVWHYTTKVVEVCDGRVAALDGFSLTDRDYIASELPRGYELHFRKPRGGNPAIFVKTPEGEILIPQMSFDIAFFDDETAEFYVKPLRKLLGVGGAEELRSAALVVNQYGEAVPASRVKPEYFPSLRDYEGEKPDLTITIKTRNRDGGVREDVVDVFGKYYVKVSIGEHPWYGRRRVPEFLGYVWDIHGIIPPVVPERERIDAWRTISLPRDWCESEWVRLTESEWCGAYSETAAKLEGLERSLVELLRAGALDAVATVVGYTSNLFVVYVDFYVKPASKTLLELRKAEIEEAVRRIRDTAAREIFDSLFPGLR
jgi:hypothetical protein